MSSAASTPTWRSARCRQNRLLSPHEASGPARPGSRRPAIAGAVELLKTVDPPTMSGRELTMNHDGALPGTLLTPTDGVRGGTESQLSSAEGSRHDDQQVSLNPID